MIIYGKANGGLFFFSIATLLINVGEVDLGFWKIMQDN